MKQWTVKFKWSSALQYHTFMTLEEAQGFAKMFGKKILVSLNEKLITIQ